MKQSKDPFEVAFEEEDEEDNSPPDSPVVPADNEIEPQTENQRGNLHTTTAAGQSEYAAPQVPVDVHNNTTQEDYDDEDYDNDHELTANAPRPPTNTNTTNPLKSGSGATAASLTGKTKEDEEEEEEEENMDVELGNPSTSDPDKMSKMQAILTQFTEEQMSRYESFRRSGFQKSNMKRLLASITGSAKISIPMTIVVSGIAKLFVGELVEAARIVMSERNESGPIRPCHMREAYRRLKLEGKVPKRSVPRLFR